MRKEKNLNLKLRAEALEFQALENHTGIVIWRGNTEFRQKTITAVNYKCVFGIRAGESKLEKTSEVSEKTKKLKSNWSSDEEEKREETAVRKKKIEREGIEMVTVEEAVMVLRLRDVRWSSRQSW